MNNPMAFVVARLLKQVRSASARATIKNLFLMGAATAAVLTSVVAEAAEHANKTPLQIHAHPGFPCVSFQLEGVSVADTSVSTSPWFSLRKDHPHFAELFAILLTGKGARLPVRVITAGTACGNASVDLIFLG